MNRLDAIISLIENVDVLADIGTDHGYVCERALREKRVKRVIAADINKMPLDSAVKNLTECGFAEVCEFRLGSGLEVLKKDEADLAVIAGMGGELIGEILDKNSELSHSVKRFILQPMQNIDKLRIYLSDNGYSIEKELIVKETYRYYFIMSVINKKSEITDDIFLDTSEYLFVQRDLLFKEYLEKRINDMQIIIDNLDKSCSKDGKVKKEIIENKQNKYRELVESYEC